MEIPNLHSARLSLRPLDLKDSEIIRHLLADGTVAANGLGIPHPFPEGEERRFIQKMNDRLKDDVLTWGMVVLDSGELIGMISLSVHPQHNNGELGYWLGKAYWNKGYATEAVKCVIRFGFEQLKLHRIFAESFRENEASRQVMEKAGMSYEGLLREHLKHWNGEYKDLYHYGILASEYKKGGDQTP